MRTNGLTIPRFRFELRLKTEFKESSAAVFISRKKRTMFRETRDENYAANINFALFDFLTCKGVVIACIWTEIDRFWSFIIVEWFLIEDSISTCV